MWYISMQQGLNIIDETSFGAIVAQVRPVADLLLVHEQARYRRPHSPRYSLVNNTLQIQQKLQ